MKTEIFPQGDSIEDYALVPVKNTFIFFGGYPFSKTIATFSTVTKQWKKIGELIPPRNGHGVFARKDDFIVVGSY